MTPVVRFEDEADAEYREAGRWYDVRQAGLGLQFFDEVDAAIRRIVPRLGARFPARPETCQVVFRPRPVAHPIVGDSRHLS